MKDLLQPSLGTDLKINIHIDACGGYSMDDYDFKVDFFVYSNRSLTIKKKEMIRIDSGNYVASFNSYELGVGPLQCRITAEIPDEDCDDGFRKEIVTLTTDVVICK